jgi:predicted SnoaL-like aldol condensation-catalyzing enzyme
MQRRSWALGAAILACGFGALVADTPAVGASVGAKAVVLAFYKVALQEMRPAQAFQRYAAADFVEHSQDSPGGSAQATVQFLDQLIARSPHPKWEVVRSAAEGDLVFLHSRYTAGPGAPEIAVAEIFRVRGGKLVEHWDVISGPPDKVVNPNSRF